VFGYSDVSNDLRRHPLGTYVVDIDKDVTDSRHRPDLCALWCPKQYENPASIFLLFVEEEKRK
jgi:hypothetical protein